MLIFISFTSIILVVFISESSLEYINLALCLIIHFHDLTRIWLTILSFSWTHVVVNVILIVAHSFKLVLTLILVLRLVKYFENISVHLLQLSVSVLSVDPLWSIQKFQILLQMSWNLVPQRQEIPLFSAYDNLIKIFLKYVNIFQLKSLFPFIWVI